MGMTLMISLAVLPFAVLTVGAPETRFSVVQEGGRDWLANADGRRFHSLGVCCVNRGLAAQEWDDTNPGYSASRLFTTDAAWAKDSTRRLAEWGFNTVGAWSDHSLLRGNLYQTPVLHLGASGIPWKDMWDPSVIDDTYRIAREGVAPNRDDPRVIGYFSDNELGWWYGAMFEWAWKATPEHGTRDRLVALLREAYPGVWQTVTEDFDCEGATDFATLQRAGRLFLRPGGHGMAYVRKVMRLLAARYYELCRDAIRRADPGALFLGDRYISNFYPEVAEEAGKVADIVSTNLNANWSDGSFAPFYLEELHRRARKPLLVTEFYMCAMQNRSGNMNDASGFPTVSTQRERVEGLKRQLAAMFAKPYLVGAHWFQFYDEPMHGRSDGENYNMGLVDIVGRPYEPLLRAFASAEGRNPTTREPSNGSIPPIDPSLARDLGRWPRERARTDPSGEVRGDLYLSWHPSGLFVAIQFDEDRFAEAFYRSGTIPSEDRARLVLEIDGLKRPVEARLGLGGDLDLTEALKLTHEAGTRNCAVFRIPTRAFGRARFKAGDRIVYRATLDTRGRAYRTTWRGERTLGKNP
ncbi:MAG: hypothetical protein KIS66_07045 [Fimbriimonadaceae bacterium]|nr:hypothetical protein [Fimbriimonadaceae bacterium]